MGKSGLIGDFHALDFYRRVGGIPLISEEMKAVLDKDTQQIMHTCLEEVTTLLKKEEPLLERLAKELVLKEELNYDEIESIFKEFGKIRPSP
jgi:ATP-dependent Zn protease